MGLIETLISDLSDPAKAIGEIAASLDRHNLAQHLVDITAAVQSHAQQVADLAARVEVLEKAWGVEPAAAAAPATPAPVVPVVPVAPESPSVG